MTSKILEKLPSAEYVKVLYNYDPHTGEITNKADGTPVGNEVWRNKGHLRVMEVNLNGEVIPAQYIAWMLAYGERPKRTLYHRDHNGHNNALYNLREKGQKEDHPLVAQLEVGVTRHPDGVRWNADIRIEGQKERIGTFDDEASAQKAYEARKAVEAERRAKKAAKAKRKAEDPRLDTSQPPPATREPPHGSGSEILKNKLTATYVRSILQYNARTGVLTWLPDNNWNGEPGTRAGYAVLPLKGGTTHLIDIDGVTYPLADIAWLAGYGEPPEGTVKPANGDPTDHALVNLHDARLRGTSTTRNKAHSNGLSSRHPGVYWDKAREMWRAEVTVGGVRKYLGRFYREEDAAKAYSAYLDRLRKVCSY